MDRGYWANLARMPRLHPYSFFEEHPPRIFNDHAESKPRFNVSSEEQCSLAVSPSLYWGDRTHRPQGERPLLASLTTSLPAATWFSEEVSRRY